MMVSVESANRFSRNSVIRIPTIPDTYSTSNFLIIFGQETLECDWWEISILNFIAAEPSWSPVVKSLIRVWNQPRQEDFTPISVVERTDRLLLKLRLAGIDVINQGTSFIIMHQLEVRSDDSWLK